MAAVILVTAGGFATTPLWHARRADAAAAEARDYAARAEANADQAKASAAVADLRAADLQNANRRLDAEKKEQRKTQLYAAQISLAAVARNAENHQYVFDLLERSRPLPQGGRPARFRVAY